MSVAFIVVGVVIAVPVVAMLIKVCSGAPKKAKKGERAEIMRQLLAQSEHENSTPAIASHPARNPARDPVSSMRSDTSKRGPNQVQNSKGRRSPTNPNSSTSRRPSRLDAEIEAQIRQRAYELYQERSGAGGDPTDDWEQAKREVLSRKAKAATTSS
jgi:hypothetical protein